MPSRNVRRHLLHPFLAAGLLASAPLVLGADQAKNPANPVHAAKAQAPKKVHYHLAKVASFDHQVTGVAVSREGRIFVNFPRWLDDAPISVAEVTPDGKLTPYPDAGWNAWRNAKPLPPGDHFVSVQAVYADRLGSLWIVDTGAPGLAKVVAGAPKIVKFDLASNKVSETFLIAPEVAGDGHYLNDIRTTPDDQWAILTDSGLGGLVVLSLKNGKARRILDGHPSTKSDDSVNLLIDGKPLRRPDGSTPSFAADGIAIDPQGDYVYWQALRGKTLYRLKVADAVDAKIAPAALAAKVETVQATHPADGLWIASDGQLYSTDIGHHAVRVRTPGLPAALAVQDERLRWPDSLAEGGDGALYVTASDIQDSPWFNAKPTRKPAYGLFKMSK